MDARLVSYIFKLTIFSVFLVVNCHDHGDGPLPGGGECKDNNVCYSHLCYIGGICAPDGPEQGTVAGGASCSTDSDCFSGYCVEKVCAPDSPVRGKVAAGGLCISASQCYSGACLRRRCGPDSPKLGKMAAGGECETHNQCYSGVCSFQRCAPDGAEEEKAPGGGFCSVNAQCASSTCINYQCSPASLIERGRTADGGRCQGDENCQTISRCVQNVCAPRDGRNVATGSSNQQGQYQYQQPQNQQVLKNPAGAFCTQHSDCETACIHGRCTTPSRFNPLAIADGGTCDQQTSMQGQCKSGQCITNVCAVSYSNRMWTSAGAAGIPCGNHQMCYSGYCASGKCSSDSPAPLLVNYAFGTNSPQRNRGQVSAGGLCREDADCYSGFCELQTMCGPDGPKRGTLASGAICTRDEQCYSNYCFQRRCVPAAVPSPATNVLPQQSSYMSRGKVAPGGRCATSDACAQGSNCVDTYCKALDAFAQSVTNNLHLSRPSASSVGWNGTCWHSAQCREGRCLEERCTVSWFLTERYAGSSQLHRIHAALLLLPFMVMRCTWWF